MIPKVEHGGIVPEWWEHKPQEESAKQKNSPATGTIEEQEFRHGMRVERDRENSRKPPNPTAEARQGFVIEAAGESAGNRV